MDTKQIMSGKIESRMNYSEMAEYDVLVIDGEDEDLTEAFEVLRTQLTEVQDMCERQAAILRKDDCGCPCCELTREQKQRAEKLEQENKRLLRGITAAAKWLSAPYTPEHGRIIKASHVLQQLKDSTNGK